MSLAIRSGPQGSERIGDPATIDDRPTILNTFVKALHHCFTCLAVGMGLI